MSAGGAECIFCKIVAGEIPSIRVYEDERVIAFMDINPLGEGHLLIVPRQHAATVLDIDSEDLYDLALMTDETLIAEGEPIFCEGDFDDGDMFVLLDGRVSIRVRQTGRDAPDREVEVLHPGEVIGEFSVLDRRPRSATATPEVTTGR